MKNPQLITQGAAAFGSQAVICAIDAKRVGEPGRPGADKWEVYVAGGIGSGINMKNAVTIGMFPDIPLEKFHYIGNSSLTGAYSMLLSTAAEKKTYEVARNMTYLELSTVPTYMDEFVAACFLPHTDTTMFPSVEA